MSKRIHLIAIAGKVMHNLALELHHLGHEVTGSDDEIYDPARSRLAEAGLLPQEGWDEDRIHQDIDLVILGMHAQLDNPELLKAQRLKLQIVSFPEYIGAYNPDNQKVVIAGSHGKSTTTAMIMHVLSQLRHDADYLLGGLLKGFDRMVRLSSAPVMVIEGDEYLSSRVDPRPKMMHYHGDIVVITGIEWDHKNVFPTEEEYITQFRNLIQQCTSEGAHVIWCAYDKYLSVLMNQTSDLLSQESYEGYQLNEDGSILFEEAVYPIKVFGDHNLSNLKAAALVCKGLGIVESDFLKAISSFEGVGKRLELISDDPVVYLDYAHAPSKVRATVEAIRSKYPNQKILCIYELHTYSSLSADFLPQYQGALNQSDGAIVYFDHHALEMKRLPPLGKDEVIRGFGSSNLIAIDDFPELESTLHQMIPDYDVVLFMSSGTFGGLDLKSTIHA